MKIGEDVQEKVRRIVFYSERNGSLTGGFSPGDAPDPGQGEAVIGLGKKNIYILKLVDGVLKIASTIRDKKGLQGFKGTILRVCKFYLEEPA